MASISSSTGGGCPQRISEQSALAMNTALNIFNIPPTNVAIVKSHFREHLPLSTISQETPYQFRLYNDILWTDMSRIYLFLELSIEKWTDAGARWEPLGAADDNVGCCQQIGASFVQQLKMQISNQDVYDSGTLYPYKAYLTSELSYPDNVKRNFLASTGYRPISKHDDALDEGFRALCNQFAGGKRAQLMHRLDFDLGNQELYMVNNVDVLFTIYRAKDDFLIQTLVAGDTNKYRVFLHNIKMYAKMIEVQPSLNMSIYGTLERRPATYAVRRTEIKSTFITEGRTELDENIFSSKVPRRVIIALLTNRAFNGDETMSPFSFNPFDVRDISVQAAGQNYPVVPYGNLDFEKGMCTRPFVDMYEALSASHTDHSFDISMEKFRSGWCFFIIPLTSTLDDSCGFELLRSGTTTVKIQFNKSVPVGGLEMLVLGEFDQLVMVDYQRRIVTDSNIG